MNKDRFLGPKLLKIPKFAEIAYMLRLPSAIYFGQDFLQEA